MSQWDPARYLQFADARARPFLDLIGQVQIVPHTVIDLGCGPGHLTRHLRALWPDAQILGIDSSAEMIDEAIRDNTDSLANYDIADAADWNPYGPVDLIVSNAMFQWIPDHLAVIERLLGHLNPGGVFALQVPNNSSEATHQTLTELADDPRFADQLADIRRPARLDPDDYLTFFAERSCEPTVWSTTYLHVLQGENPVYDWISGTGARPFVQALDDGLRDEFVDEVKKRLRAAYPARPWGTVLPFRRTFAVATRR